MGFSEKVNHIRNKSHQSPHLPVVKKELVSRFNVAFGKNANPVISINHHHWNTRDVTSNTRDVTSNTRDVTSNAETWRQTQNVTSSTRHVTSNTRDVTSNTRDVKYTRRDVKHRICDVTHTRRQTYENRCYVNQKSNTRGCQATLNHLPLVSAYWTLFWFAGCCFGAIFFSTLALSALDRRRNSQTLGL